MATTISPDIINAETDARFYAQVHRKPGQKLDPNNPADKAYIPVWNDIHRKVAREAAAGTLVTTFDHPEVAQNLADSEVANKAAAAHLDAAAAAPDRETAQQNVAAASVASQISAQKASEASAKQPPTASPGLVQEAGKEAVKSPPPANAPAADHLAHAHAHEHARGEHRRDHRNAQGAAAQPSSAASIAPTHDMINKEANARFWARTHYKPGQNLDMSIAQDREMAKIWREIFAQVQREADAGTIVFTSPEFAPPPAVVVAPPLPAPQLQPPIVRQPPPQVMQPPPGMVPPPYAMQPPPGMQMPPGMRMPPMGPPQGMQTMPGMPGMMLPPPGAQRPPRGHHHHPGAQMGPMGPTQGPSAPSAGPAPGGAPGGAPPSAPSGSPGSPSEGAPPADTAPSPGGAEASAPSGEGGSSFGKFIAIGLAVVAGGGLIYYASTRKSSSRSSSPRKPKVLLATPARINSDAGSARAFPALSASRSARV